MTNATRHRQKLAFGSCSTVDRSSTDDSARSLIRSLTANSKQGRLSALAVATIVSPRMERSIVRCPSRWLKMAPSGSLRRLSVGISIVANLAGIRARETLTCLSHARLSLCVPAEIVSLVLLHDVASGTAIIMGTNHHLRHASLQPRHALLKIPDLVI